MSAAYFGSSHDNTIPMKQPLKITLVFTQQEFGEHKPSTSPSFQTHNSSALWGCMTLFGPSWCILVAEVWWRWGFWDAPYLFWGSVGVWRNCSCLTKKTNKMCAWDTFKSKQLRWKINKGNITAFSLTPCPDHTALRNTHPSSAKWLYCSAILSFNLYRLAHLDLHWVTVSFYLSTLPTFLKVRFQIPGVSTWRRNWFSGKKASF